MKRELTGQVVVITGAARGLGAALARSLHARGARIALLGLEPEELERVAASCGPDAAHWQVNVTDRHALERTAAEVAERFGRIDVVVANAGIAVGGPFSSSDPATFNRVIEVNLLGSIATARAFLPELVKSRGYLLQIASIAAMAPAPMMAAYCSSKAGVEAFAHCLRAEVASDGVRVGVGYLSWTDTDMVRGSHTNEGLEKMRGSLPFPLGRIYPLGPTVERIADGIARRAPHVYGQRWVRFLQPIRWTVPGTVGRLVPSQIAKYRGDIDASVDTSLVGAGGAADAAERARTGAPEAPQ
ncbi:short-chain dehydrogenase [Wenjunlia tyrosinilytica]|uniref:Short-chain dehydrogenase n=2 Tax=Wenjunlia tyrosinilytica TaxID=1544741 RepID=A0A917ZS29_9ACTN|nr:short-chain dehydrogenase/reductase [Wenjunlia tyrosinilytica]GGO89149.1 short-chain dehydrogenase [Wenjunlia tyrosinilytica]